MITQDIAEHILWGLIGSHSFSYQKRINEKFECFKFASTTEKGDVGEDFLSNLLQKLGYSDVEVIPTRRGPYDVRVRNGENDIKFEVKVATRDIHGSFQFNGIRFDTKYTHLFCLGITPTTTRYLIAPKEWLNNREDFMLVSMQKGANSSFKLTKPEGQLFSFDNFGREIAQFIDNP